MKPSPASPSGSVVVLFGPPAAGKSSLAREILTRYRALGASTPLLYLGTDQLREVISGRKFLASVRPVIYQGMREMTEAAVRAGHHVLVDGNYLDKKHRRPMFQLLARLGVRHLSVLVSCSLETGLRRNAGRVGSERVPDDYLRKVYGYLEEARAQADLCLDSERDGPGMEQRVLEWLLGAPPPASPATQHEAALVEWRAAGQRSRLAAGEVVWQAGSAAAEALLVLEGELEVVRQAPGQSPVVLHRLGPGETAGELSSLDGGPHSATLRAGRESEVVRLSSEEFRAVLRHHPALMDTVLTGMVARIRSLSGAAGSACVDLLTGLGNRRMFESVWPDLSRHPLSLALFDVDRFKGINDTFGHEAGDIVLRELAALLRDSMPETAVCLRFGGDEFVVLLPGQGRAEALELFETFAGRVREREFQVQPGVRLSTSISAGLASAPEVPADGLLAAADAAAYVSKKDGRDRVTAG